MQALAHPSAARQTLRYPERTATVVTDQHGSASLHCARVTHVNPLQVHIEGADQPQFAQLAASALLQPEIGDLVLLARSLDQCWLTSVLQRNTVGPAHIGVAHAQSLHLVHPRLHLQGTHSLQIHAHSLQVHAEHAQVQLGVVKLASRLVQIATERLCTWAEHIHTQAHSLVVRAEHRVTKVDQVDHLQAGQVLTEAEGLMQLKARHLQAKAKDSVFIDGKQILLG